MVKFPWVVSFSCSHILKIILGGLETGKNLKENLFLRRFLSIFHVSLEKQTTRFFENRTLYGNVYSATWIKDKNCTKKGHQRNISRPNHTINKSMKSTILKFIIKTNILFLDFKQPFDMLSKRNVPEELPELAISLELIRPIIIKLNGTADKVIA